MKRSFDLLISTVLILPAVIVCTVAAILIWMEARCNPLFVQPRVGREQRIFRMMKMRTMRADTAHRASHEIGTDQILRTGHFMRRTKIDELPQIWNVLIGDMSFVGPRPCLPMQTELISEREKRGVYRLRPGITGKAQLMDIDMSTPIKLSEIDAEYAAEWSFRKDVGYLIATFFGSGRGDAASRSGVK